MQSDQQREVGHGWLTERPWLRQALAPGVHPAWLFFSSKTRGPPKSGSYAVHGWVYKICVSLTRSPQCDPFGSLSVLSLPLHRTQNISVHSQSHHHWVFFLLPNVIAAHRLPVDSESAARQIPFRKTFIFHANVKVFSHILFWLITF